MSRKRFTGGKQSYRHTPVAVVDARVTETIELLIQGYSTQEICRKVHRKWGVAHNTVSHYVKRAHKALAKSTEVIRAAELTKAIRRFHHVYNESTTGSPLTKDNKTALSAAGKICEVLKLGELGKVDVNLSGKVEHEHSITTEQAETIFGILEGAGALESELAPAKTK